MKTEQNSDSARTWAILWLGGMGVILLWDAFFLNEPAVRRIQLAFLHSVLGGIAVVVMSLTAGWTIGIAQDLAQSKGRKRQLLLLTFMVNVVRSIPQIVGILLGYTVLTLLMAADMLRGDFAQVLCMSGVISVFVFPEVVDLVRERITFFRTMDFVDAMLCCGIPESRIVNREILWRNSRAHLLHKAVSILGISLFLQCSIDFVVSVGLSAEVSATNFPVTLGSVLAKLDSKQDILAIGNAFTQPSYIGALLTTHLQGITVAAVIVLSLICVSRIASGLVRRYRL
jgi:hypothetical protein